MKIPPGQEDKDWHEHYGPIDGVRPIDHMGTYHFLITSMCVGQVNNEDKIYISENYPRKRLCEECYINTGEPRNFTLLESKHTTHLIPFMHRPLMYFCYICTKRVMEKKRRARTCPECIEEHLHNRMALLTDKEVIVHKRY